MVGGIKIWWENLLGGGNSKPKLRPTFGRYTRWFIFFRNVFYQKQRKYAMNIGVAQIRGTLWIVLSSLMLTLGMFRALLSYCYDKLLMRFKPIFRLFVICVLNMCLPVTNREFARPSSFTSSFWIWLSPIRPKFQSNKKIWAHNFMLLCNTSKKCCGYHKCGGAIVDIN